MLFKTPNEFTCLSVPQDETMVRRARQGDLAIGTQRYTVNRAIVAMKPSDEATRLGIPQDETMVR